MSPSQDLSQWLNLQRQDVMGLVLLGCSGWTAREVLCFGEHLLGTPACVKSYGKSVCGGRDTRWNTVLKSGKAKCLSLIEEQWSLTAKLKMFYDISFKRWIG